MRLILSFAIVAFGSVHAVPSLGGNFTTWSPPGPDDVRAPCPMLNTLANHGFLPHSGKNLSVDVVSEALFIALNINKTLGEFLFNFAITTNPDANATTFSLDNLSRHGILEHDGSLSRGDDFYGDDHSFNQTIFDETKSYWIGEDVDIQSFANGRHARLVTSLDTNPAFTLSELGAEFSYGENAALIIFFGDIAAGTAKKSLLEYFFEHEKLPIELGWTPPEALVEQDDLFGLMQQLFNASESFQTQHGIKRSVGDLHAGMPFLELEK